MNRAPSALDPWWEDHRRTCGGTYTKVKEPEGYGKKGKKDAKKNGKTSENKATGNGKPASTTTGDEFFSSAVIAVNVIVYILKYSKLLNKKHTGCYTNTINAMTPISFNLYMHVFFRSQKHISDYYNKKTKVPFTTDLSARI